MLRLIDYQYPLNVKQHYIRVTLDSDRETPHKKFVGTVDFIFTDKDGLAHIIKRTQTTIETLTYHRSDYARRQFRKFVSLQLNELERNGWNLKRATIAELESGATFEFEPGGLYIKGHCADVINNLYYCPPVNRESRAAADDTFSAETTVTKIIF